MFRWVLILVLLGQTWLPTVGGTCQHPEKEFSARRQPACCQTRESQPPACCRMSHIDNLSSNPESQSPVGSQPCCGCCLMTAPLFLNSDRVELPLDSTFCDVISYRSVLIGISLVPTTPPPDVWVSLPVT